MTSISSCTRGEAAYKESSYFLSRLLAPDFRLRSNDAPTDLRPQTTGPLPMKLPVSRVPWHHCPRSAPCAFVPKEVIMRIHLRHLNSMALLTGLSLILFVIEAQIPPPLPLPGVKIGLANVVTVYAACRYGLRDAFLILLVRIFLAGIFAGQAPAFLYSLSGGITCLLGMAALRRLIPLHFLWLISIAGAILHNTGQILAAVFLTGTKAAALYWPLLALTGAAAGALTGMAAQYMLLRFGAVLAYFEGGYSLPYRGGQK